MEIVKKAKFGEYNVLRDEEGSIMVITLYDNAKGALREVAEKEGFEVDPNWNTRQLGSKLIKKINGESPKTKARTYAWSGEYCIDQEADGAIKVFKVYDNVKGALREISGKVGFEFDANWNTRQFGAKLIEFLNSK